MEKVLNYLKSNPNYVWGMIITFAVLILACVLGYFINKYNLLAFIDKWLDKNSKNKGKPTEKPKHKDDLPDFGFEFDSPEDLVAMEREKEKQKALSNSNANNASDEISHNDEIENASSVEESEEKKEDQPKKSKFSQMIHQSLQEYTHEDYEEDKKFASSATPIKPKEPENLPNDDLIVEEEHKGKWRIMSNGNTYVAELHTEEGLLLLKSQCYSELSDAKNAIDTLKKHILDNNFTVVANKKGKYSFKLLTSTNRLVCLGEQCDTKNDCLNRISDVKRIAFTAEIVRG